MIEAPSQFVGIFAQAAATARPMTTEERDRLQTLLTSAGIQPGAHPADVLAAIALPRTVPNPQARGTITRPEWSTSELANWLLQQPAPGGAQGSLYVFIEGLASGTDAQALMVREFMASLRHLPALNMTNPKVAGGFQAFRTANLLTQQQFVYLTTLPDPNWSETVELPSRLEEAGFDRWIPTAQEIAEALA